MKERIPDSTGLPLRAMVMVLLFLGVIFLLLGWQALSSGGSDDESASPAAGATTTSAATSTGAKPAGNQAEVQVYNISSKEGVASHTKDQLTAAGFKVTKVDNLAVPDVSATTVYYTDADDEHATADAVGRNLGGVPVVPRIPALSNQPPGVIVLVAG
jgi:hypothetical protein